MEKILQNRNLKIVPWRPYWKKTGEEENESILALIYSACVKIASWSPNLVTENF